MDVLLNWLTQGLVVAIAAAAGLRLIPSSRPQQRYGFAWAAYVLVMSLPAVPLIVAATTEWAAPPRLASIAAPRVSMPAAWWTSTEVAAGLVLLWLAVHATRLALGGFAVRRARRQSGECPEELLAALPFWSQVRSTGRPTRVVVSNRVRFAAVLGCGSPVIALAPSLDAQLDRSDLDRVLVHEWAHVQRRDDIAQLAQRLVRVIVGWHPAAWWLERQLEFEREAACDEMAVRITGSAKSYATCLTTLAALPRARVQPLPALAAVSTPRLQRRLVRILAPRRATPSRGARAAAFGVAAALWLLALGVSHVRVVAATLSPVVPIAEAAVRRAAILPAVVNAVESLAAGSAVAESTRSAAASPPAPTADPTDAPTSVDHQQTTDGGAQTDRGRTVAPVVPQEPLEPLASVSWPPVAAHVIDLPAQPPTSDPAVNQPQATVQSEGQRSATTGGSQASDKARTPWGAAADAGVALGRTSQNAGVATAGFFSRFGKAVARSF